MESAPEHRSVRIVLLNQRNEMLLMKAEDPSTTETDGTYNGAFWFPIGGEIESGEDVKKAAYRELLEETGLTASQVELGPFIWYGDFHLVLSGQNRHMKQQFLLARTTETDVNMAGLTESEKKVVKTVEWFSLDRMQKSEEIIYPVGLDEYLEPILDGVIPKQPLKVVLDRKPIRRRS